MQECITDDTSSARIISVIQVTKREMCGLRRIFCEQNLGMFINHEPFERAYPSAYVETRAFAKEYFGTLDEELWSPDAKADCSSGCGE